MKGDQIIEKGRGANVLDSPPRVGYTTSWRNFANVRRLLIWYKAMLSPPVLGQMLGRLIRENAGPAPLACHCPNWKLSFGRS